MMFLEKFLQGYVYSIQELQQEYKYKEFLLFPPTAAHSYFLEHHLLSCAKNCFFTLQNRSDN